MNVPSSNSVTSSIIAGIAQEAGETMAQTKAEAAKGDHQAIQKLARQQGPIAGAPPSQSAPQTGANRSLDVKA